MPDGSEGVGRSPRQTQSVEAVGAWISSLGPNARPLGPSELKVYSRRETSSGWRLKIDFPNGVRNVDVLLDEHFPYKPPLIALVDRPNFLTWPHVEKDGALCLLHEGSDINFWDPVSVCEHIIKLACELIESCESGDNQEEFRDEFSSYWHWAANEGATIFRSLLNPDSPTRKIRVWQGKEFYLVAEQDEDLISWLTHSFRGTKTEELKFQDGAFLWLEQPLIPSEYPRTAAEVLSLVRTRTSGGTEIVEQLASIHPTNLLVVLGALSSNGPCLAGLVVNRPGSSHAGIRKASRSLTRGFRPNKVPKPLMVSRLFGATPLTRSPVERIDAKWIHGRGQDQRFDRLRTANVAVLGCGSVGASVAEMLAEAGVGRLLLVDPEKLAPSNIGRHPLGSKHVGLYKSEALAKNLETDYPHIRGVAFETERWQKLLQRSPAILDSCDLIISAIGSWEAEGALNDWHVSSGRTHPILYGWTEAHACAGHAVAVTKNGGCFHCGVSEVGLPLLQVTDWSEAPQQFQEPACGAVYQPYGPIELTHVVALISELALDCLIGSVIESTHRIWAGRQTLLERVGGRWSERWASLYADRPEGGFMAERAWASSESCNVCRAEAS